jgi:bacterioferritin-associated ferredoxin
MPNLICICNRVSHKDIARIVSKFPDATLPDVIVKTAASASCGRCKHELKTVYNRLKEKQNLPDKPTQLSIAFDFSDKFDL